MADINITLAFDDGQMNQKIDGLTRTVEDFAAQSKTAFNSITDELGKLSNNMSPLGDALSGLRNQIIGLASVTALVNMTEWANTMSQTAVAVGMTTGQLMELQVAVTNAGGSARAASLAIEMFYMKLDQARQGGTQQQYAFERLGITLQDLKNLDDQALFKKTIEQLALLPPNAERGRLEVELFSKSFRGIPISFLNQQLNEMNGRFGQSGPAIDTAGAAFRQLETDMALIRAGAATVFQPLLLAFSKFAPTVEQVTAVIKVFAGILAVIAVESLITSIGSAAKIFGILTPAVRAASMALEGFSIAEAVAANATGLGALLNLVLKLVAGLAIFFGVEAAMNKILNDSAESNKTAADAANENTKANLANSQAANEVYTSYARMVATIREQTKAFQANIDAQIRMIQTRGQEAGLSEVARAQMTEETKVREEFARKIEEVTIRLRAAQASKPGSDEAHTVGALIESLHQLITAEDSYIEKARTAAGIAAERNNRAQMALLLAQDQAKINKTLSDIQTNIDELTMSKDQIKIANIQKQTAEYIKLATEKRQAQMGSDTNAQDLANDKILQDTIATIKEKQQAVISATQSEITASRDWGTGWKGAFEQYKSDATDAAATSKKLFDDSTKGMEDALVNFAKTGKLSFNNLLATIAEDIMRSQIKSLFAQMFGGSGGAGGGSAIASGFAWLSSLMGFASGGDVQGNTPVIVGEQGPEIFMPKSAGSIVPNGALSNMSRSGQQNAITQVTYNITATDATSFKNMLAADPTYLYALTQQGAKSIPTGAF
jgi:lambda family phage tail tape measure protein